MYICIIRVKFTVRVHRPLCVNGSFTKYGTYCKSRGLSIQISYSSLLPKLFSHTLSSFLSLSLFLPFSFNLLHLHIWTIGRLERETQTHAHVLEGWKWQSLAITSGLSLSLSLSLSPTYCPNRMEKDATTFPIQIASPAVIVLSHVVVHIGLYIYSTFTLDTCTSSEKVKREKALQVLTAVTIDE